MENHEFKPKEWVLVRDTDEQNWRLGIYSHYDKDNHFPYRCVGMAYTHCIPYEGNEHLLGTDKPVGTPVELDGWKVGDNVEVQYCKDLKWYAGTIIEIDTSHTDFCGNEFPYKVKASCFHESFGSRWCSREQLRKPEEKPEEEFKFGDWVEVLEDSEWTVGIVTEVDKDDEFATYHVNFPDDDGWYGKSEVRKHEKG